MTSSLAAVAVICASMPPKSVSLAQLSLSGAKPTHWQPEQVALGHLRLDTSERELITFLTAAYSLPLLPM